MNITKGKIARAKKVVVYGPEGIGKSTFASQFPDPLFIDTEGSTSELNISRLDKPSSWTFLLQQIDFVKQRRNCRTLVVDTIDWAERLAIDFVTSRANKQSITSFGYGEGFIQLEEEYGKFLNKLTDLIEIGINVVLSAHAKITKFEQPDEMGAYDRWELKLGNKTTAKTAALTKEWADMVLFMNYKTFSVATDDKGKKFKGQGGERVIYTTHNPAWDAKNRQSLPDEIPLDYKHIARLFEDATPVQQTPTVPVEPPKVEQPPVEKPVPAPVQEQPAPKEAPSADALLGINETIPKALADLMRTHNVNIASIQEIVGQRGYYPADTPIANYDPGFIQGVLVGAWDQVHQMIKDNLIEIPFQ